jgi:hypothetical protein
MLVGFLNFHVEGIIRHKILFDLLWRQLNQHTCDLWCFFLSCHSYNVVENALTNLVFQIWVLFRYCWNNFGCLHDISLLNSHVLRWNHWHSIWSHRLHWGKWLWNHSWLWSLWHSLLVIHTMSLIILMMLNLVLLHLVVLVVLIVVSVLVIRSSSSMSLVVSVSLVHLCMS